MTLSVIIVTYNHVKYISQAIESVLSQKANFDFEILIGEDASIDGTREICQKYAERYPKKITLFLRNRKDVIYVDGKPTGRYNFIETIKQAKGKYIALLDGDDFWTDKYKLQKQVDFLNKNKDYVICFHRVTIVDKDNNVLKTSNPDEKETSEITDILSRGWFIHTGSLVFRNFLLQELPDFFYKYGSADYMLHVLLSQHGKIGFINSVMSIYRVHQGGITRNFEKTIIPFLKKKILLLDEIDFYLNRKYSKYISVLKKNIHSQLFIEKLKTKKLKLLISGLRNFILGNKKNICLKFVNHRKHV